MLRHRCKAYKERVSIIKKERFQIDLTTEQVDALDALVEKTGATTRAELLRKALRFYGWLADLEPEQLVEVSQPDGKLLFLGKAKLLR